MKRTLVILLAMLYMVSATGATVHLHYCMDKLVGAGFGHDDDELCGKCGMDKSVSKKCCHDEHKTVKAADHQFSKCDFKPLPVVEANLSLPVRIATTDGYVLCSTVERTCLANAPPLLRQHCPVYLFVRNIRI